MSKTHDPSLGVHRGKKTFINKAHITSMNSWPGGFRHGMTQSEHERWNASNYPGTRQLCSVCEDPTGRCEEDAMLSKDGEPLCVECNEIYGAAS